MSVQVAPLPALVEVSLKTRASWAAYSVLGCTGSATIRPKPKTSGEGALKHERCIQLLPEIRKSGLVVMNSPEPVVTSKKALSIGSRKHDVSSMLSSVIKL